MQSGAKCIKVCHQTQNVKKGEEAMAFLGEYRHVIDAKNRLFIPAKLREDLGESFYVTRKITEHCLAIYAEEEWQNFSSKLNSLPDSKVGRIKQFIFSKTAQLSPDSHGRILLPANLVEYAKLEKNVVVAGVGDHIQIWNEADWDIKEQEIDLVEMESLLSELGL